MPHLPGEVRDRRVTGRVDFHRDWKNKWLNFTNVTFEEAVDFSGVQARGIGFYGCRFRKGLDLSGISIDGDLTAHKTAFHSDAASGGPGLRLDGARLGGGVKILGCSVEGGVFAENTRVGGDADFRGIHVYAKGGAPLGADLENLADKDEFLESFGYRYPHLVLAFKLAGSRIDGNLLLSALQDEKVKSLRDYRRFPRIAFVGGPIELANVEISGDLDVAGLVTTQGLSLQNSIIKGNISGEAYWAEDRLVRFVVGQSFDLYGVQIAGNIGLSSAYIGRGVRITFAKVSGYLFAREEGGKPGPPLELGRGDRESSLDLSGSQFGGVQFDGVKMAGLARAVTGEFGRFYLTPLDTNPGAQNIQAAPCEAAGVYMRSVTIKESARFFGLRLKPFLSEHPITEKGFERAFQMINCSVGGDLLLGSDGLCKYLYPGLPSYKKGPTAALAVPASFNFASVPGNHPPPRQSSTEWWDTDARYPSTLAEVNLSGTKVERDLNLNCLVADRDIILDHVTVGGDIHMSRTCYSYGNPIVVKGFSTRCQNLSATALHCGGDAGMTGLDVEESAKARHLNTQGSLLFAEESSSDDCAKIKGDLDLQGASASMLVFSGKNFGYGHGDLNLSDTEFRKVTVKAAGDLPSRITMLQFHNASVARWEIEEQERGTPAFHRKTEPVKGGAYVSIERYLREEGRFDEANRILLDRFRGSAWQDIGRGWQRPGSKVVRWLSGLGATVFGGLLWLAGEFIGFGTRPWPSLLVILAVFSWTTHLFRDPNNVDAAPALRARLTGISAGEIHPGDPQCPQYCGKDSDCVQICQGWNRRNALSLAARYNVPIAGSAIEDAWRPSLKVSTVMRLISYSNWLFWPLFLGTFARYVLRRL